MTKKTLLIIRGEKMEDSMDFVDFFMRWQGKKIIVVDTGFSQLSRGASKTCYVRIEEVQSSTQKVNDNE